MALNITTLSTRLGEVFQGVNVNSTFAGTTAVTQADAISTLYSAFASQREVVDDLYEQLRSVHTSLDGYNAYLQTVAVETLRQMERDDSSRPKSDDVVGWIDKLNREMASQAETYARPTVTAAVSVPFTNIGDGYLVASVWDPTAFPLISTGSLNTASTWANQFTAKAEVIKILCTSDSYSGDTQAGSESFSADGETAVDVTAYDWPKGSGLATTLTVNLNTDLDTLTDPGLEAWGGSGNNTPTSWTLIGGTVAGTHITRNSTSPYRGTYNATLTGDGAAVVGITQLLDQDVIRSNTNYAVMFWYKCPTTVSTANLRVAFTSDTTGTVITDNAGNSQSSTLNAATLNAAGSTWTRATATFRTPRNLPDALYLELRAPAGNLLDNADTIQIDDITLCEMELLYPGGPYAALIAGETAFARDDGFSLTIANDATTSTFVLNYERTFDLANLGLRLLQTTAGTASQLNALITD